MRDLFVDELKVVSGAGGHYKPHHHDKDKDDKHNVKYDKEDKDHKDKEDKDKYC
jgi:hypothetical protein